MGIDNAYEAPESPEPHILTVQENLDKISSFLLAKVDFSFAGSIIKWWQKFSAHISYYQFMIFK